LSYIEVLALFQSHELFADYRWCLHSKCVRSFLDRRGISKARHCTVFTSRKWTHDVEVCCLYGK
jgi:hypothetical protein